MEPQKESHLTTAYIALICASLGWVTWGIAAIPGVIIAHTIRSTEPSTAIARKAALRVGYPAIFVGVAAALTMAAVYLGLVSRLKVNFAVGNSSSPEIGGKSSLNLDEWAWRAGIFFAALIALVLVLPLIRKGYASFQSARILRANSSR